MREKRAITHVFVDSVPTERDEGKLYVSMKFRTVVHNCFCGCGTKVVTPLKPSAWQMLFDGDTVTLQPSIGNSGHACGAHYWIRKGWALPAGRMTEADIERGRARDQALQDAYYGTPVTVPTETPVAEATPPRKKRGFWSWLGRRR